MALYHQADALPEIFYKDWGSGQPIVSATDGQLSADDWDPQMTFLPASTAERSTSPTPAWATAPLHETRGGHDRDHYATTWRR